MGQAGTPPVTHPLLHLNYDLLLSPAELFRRHREWAEETARPLYPPRAEHANDPAPERALRVGYVSGDFRRHPVLFFIEPVLRCHDPARFEVFCYSNSRSRDDANALLRSHVRNWRDVADLDDDALARLIRDDGIDILVDLSGHTGDSRLLVFARKPAPVQVSALGYPATTGLATIDYRLTDAWCDPPGATEAFHSETLWRLPSGFNCYTPPTGLPDPGPLPALANGYVTFGSFNRLDKAGPAVIDLWAEILARVPGSRLVLKSEGLDDTATRAGLIERFLAKGVGPERLVLSERLPTIGEHFAAYARIDIALDTFPYNGTTTTCEALWMGCPVVTLTGETHAARVSTGILMRLGLSALAARSRDEYVGIAAALAREPAALAALRRTLRARMVDSPLTDAARYTRELEAAYRAMWRAWCAGRGGAGPARPGQPGEAGAAGGNARARAGSALAEAVRAIPFWYHRIELPGGLVTPGWAPLDPGAYRLPVSLAGKRVLDVGAWDGYWSFEALKRGAREVVAIDDFSDQLGVLDRSAHATWATFDLCRAALGYDEARCRRIEMSVYDVSEAALGRFDVVFFFGTLYHLRHPLLALDRLSAVCDGEIYVECAILDDFSPYRGGAHKGYAGAQMVMEFYPDDQYGGNATNWWVPTLHCLGHMVRAAGFPEVEGWKLREAPASLSECRGFVTGRKPGR